jgi:hypothetical protein
LNELDNGALTALPEAAAPSRPPALPLEFRQELLPHVFKALRSGWSAAIVALPGGGLSNLLRFMAEPRVTAHYLGDEAAHTLLLYLEGDDVADADTLPGHLTQHIVAAARLAQWPRAEQAALRRLADSTGPATALAEMLTFIQGVGRGRVVVVGDEFDGPLSTWPAAALRQLRRLRDDHKYHLAFIIGVRAEPETLAAERAGEAGRAKFAELFEAHTFALQPYSQADAVLALARKTVGWAQGLTPEQADALYRASGGHPKLLLAALVYLEGRLHLPWANVERGLNADPGVVAVCAALWQALDSAEQAALWHLAGERRDAIPEAALARLRLRGLAVGGPPFVFGTIFEHYLNGLPAPSPEVLAAPPRMSRLRDPNAKLFW